MTDSTPAKPDRIPNGAKYIAYSDSFGWIFLFDDSMLGDFDYFEEL